MQYEVFKGFNCYTKPYVILLSTGMVNVPAQAILLALDRKDREREMVSVLLAALHPNTLSEDAIAQGFTSLMLACEVCTI